MLVEYDILSSAGNRSFAKAKGAVPEQLRIAHQKSSGKNTISIELEKGCKKWRKAK